MALPTPQTREIFQQAPTISLLLKNLMERFEFNERTGTYKLPGTMTRTEYGILVKFQNLLYDIQCGALPLPLQLTEKQD